MHKINKLYVQFGSGNEAISGWESYDSSPTLIIQKIPLIGWSLRSRLNCHFDKAIKYGDIVRGLPVKDNSVDGLFCSHVLEHLSYPDLCKALDNCFRYLKEGALFRIIVPDLSWYVCRYINQIGTNGEILPSEASIELMKGTRLGLDESRSTVKKRLISAFQGSGHRWMWDYLGLAAELERHGFVDIKKFKQGDSIDEMFLRPERDHQFGDSDACYGLSIECRKPSSKNA